MEKQILWQFQIITPWIEFSAVHPRTYPATTQVTQEGLDEDQHNKIAKGNTFELPFGEPDWRGNLNLMAP